MGAVIRDSIIMPGTVIKSGAVVQYAIVAENAVIEENAVVGERPEAMEDLDKWGVAVIGKGVTVKKGMKLSLLSERLVDVLDGFLGVAEAHLGVLLEEQRVLHASVSGSHRALEYYDVASLPDLKDRHSVNRAALVLSRSRVDGVVRADDEYGIGILKVRVLGI